MNYFLLRWRKKRHCKRKMRVIEMKIWDLEFLKEKLLNMREGFRVEYDLIKEKVDASQRRMYGEMYEFWYSASGDKVDIRELPIMPADIPNLPDTQGDTKDFRFFKTKRENSNNETVEAMKNYLDGAMADLEQLKKQMYGLDGQIHNEGGVVEQMDSYHAVLDLLKKYKNKI